MNHIPGSDGFDCLEQRSEDRLVGADFIAGHVSYDGPEAQLFEVVLLLEFAVTCNENVKGTLSFSRVLSLLPRRPISLTVVAA